MTWIVQNLWLIPALPLLAAGLSALLKRPQRALSAGLAIGSMGASFVLSCVAFAAPQRISVPLAWPLPYEFRYTE